MKQPTNWLDNWVNRNSWAILSLIVVLAVWGGVLSKRVEAAEKNIDDLKELITQVVILQEQYKNTAVSISEIKTDIKEIKAAVK